MTTTEAFSIRDGEVTTELPATADAGVYYIGRIRTPWTDRKQCPKNPRGSDAVCTVELDPRFTDALKDVETCTHLVLLYWMDKAPRNLVRQVPGHGASGGAQHGTFALRSPARPNPIAMSVVKLFERRGRQALGGRPRLPRRHAAARHQALSALGRFRPRGGLRLAAEQDVNFTNFTNFMRPRERPLTCN